MYKPKKSGQYYSFNLEKEAGLIIMNVSNHRFRDITKGLIYTTVLFLFFAFDQALGQERQTEVTIKSEQFHINGNPTYEGQKWITSDGEEYPIEGLLMNARLIQGTFDDVNSKTRGQWAYPDTREWDPDRNTQEFVDAMASWQKHGLLGIAVNLQGGCPYGYCGEQRWDNSAFVPDGSLREDYMNRLERILDRADELGMVAILGYFYFGQDENLQDEQAVIHAVENATEWILKKGYRNVIVEINNECNIRYDHPILQCDRVHELIEQAKNIEHNGHSLYVSTSLGGGSVPPPNIVGASDYVLLHGNGVENPERIVEMIREVREMGVYSPMPIVFNEDDQPWRVDEQGWGEEGNNFVASVKNYASWGYFDFRRPQERDEFNEGYQSVPVNWQISSERKRNFFDLLARITDSPGTPRVHINFDQKVGKGNIDIEEEKYSDISIDKVELIINNKVITTVEAPFDFSLDEFGYELPAGEHWVRARITYKNGQRKVIVESPYYKNPWWPYGGW
ncbi:hypothetical protein LQ318_07480 [Aliifodinibius salicampi]|uniref:Cellulase (Glycosyl hydrolase family 5) n=1 Tax=Fodinibius salicampi TaxID=1920655 RepID=A0ABT3PY83_9BACT|nr:hypothetical protein [Fodinibius salicampi]MCW9712741.1 hypothetical protein [Fodinibius salicampi]